MAAPAIAVAVRLLLTRLAGKAVVQNAGSHMAVKLGKKVLFTSQSEKVAGQFAKGFNMGLKGQQLKGHQLLSTKMGFHKSQEITAQLKTSVKDRMVSEIERDIFGGSDYSQRGGVHAISKVKSNSFRRTGRGSSYKASNVRGAKHSSQSTKGPKFSNFKGTSVKYGRGPKFSNTKFSNFNLKNQTRYSSSKHSNIKYGKGPKFSSAKYSNAKYSNQRR